MGAAQIVSGPGTPPGGQGGSAHLATGTLQGDGSSQILNTAFAGTKLSSLTSLSYSAYMANNGPTNNQQFPYMQLFVSLDGDTQTLTGGLYNSNSANYDILTFEPPYQTPGTGGPTIPNQQPTALNTWQNWNALIGGWWDSNQIIGKGYGGYDEVGLLSTLTALYPNATIVNFDNTFLGGATPTTFGGLGLYVGFADNTSTFDGNVDNISIGTTTGGTTTYAFSPNSAGPRADGNHRPLRADRHGRRRLGLASSPRS